MSTLPPDGAAGRLQVVDAAGGWRYAITLILVMLVPLATVGPMISHRVRTEHIFAVMAAVVLLAIHRKPWRLTTGYWIVISAWTAVFAIALLGSILPSEPFVVGPNRTVAGGLARLGLPILGLVIGACAWRAIPMPSRRRRLRQTSPLDAMMIAIVIVACANAVVAVVSTNNELPWLAAFHADEITTTVSHRATQGGRYGGVINQPLEAGLLYSVALLTVCRLWVTRTVGMVWLVVPFSLISVGGLVSGSKAFLFGGLPLALAYLLLSQWPIPVRRLVGAGLVSAAIGGAWHLLSVSNELGFHRVRALYQLWDLEDPRSALFGFRLDSGGTTLDTWRAALRETGVFGLGATGVGGPYDLGIIEYLAVAGWAGVAAIVVISVVLLATSASYRHDRYWLALSVLLLAANLGGPGFTANRNSLAIWVLLGAMLLGDPHYRPPASGEGDRSRSLVAPPAGGWSTGVAQVRQAVP